MRVATNPWDLVIGWVPYCRVASCCRRFHSHYEEKTFWRFHVDRVSSLTAKFLSVVKEFSSSKADRKFKFFGLSASFTSWDEQTKLEKLHAFASYLLNTPQKGWYFLEGKLRSDRLVFIQSNAQLAWNSMHHKEFCVPGSRIVHFVRWELSCEVGLCISFGGSIIAAPRRQFHVRFWNSMSYSQQKTEWDKLRFSDEAALITPSQFLCRAVCITPSTAIFCWCCFGLVPHQNSLRDWVFACSQKATVVCRPSIGRRGQV